VAVRVLIAVNRRKVSDLAEKGLMWRELHSLYDS
jgi:hypothetical protein